jgi:Flp pilus assembly protein TadD
MFPTVRRARQRRLALALGAMMVLVGCTSGNGSKVVSGSPRNAQAAAGSVTQAQALLYTSQYSDAEAAFRQATRQYPWYADGHAALALFLNYQRRFSEAVGEVAQARSLDAVSAFAAAVDTRVHDWSAHGQDQLKAASAVGAEAVNVGPRSALTHAFYGETLADTGDIPNAIKELDAATALASTTYERSEVERERANLALDSGDKAAQLTHLEAAQELQPGWAERTRELAEYYFVNDQSGRAVGLVRKAISMAPMDANLRLTLGAEALVRQDIGLADESYTAANDLRPHDAGVESTLAMTHFTLHHDFTEAEKLLRAAAADAPADLDIAGLLEGFLRYVKGDQKAAAAVTVGVPPREPLNPRASFPADLADTRHQAEQQALSVLNATRATAGLAPVHVDNRISRGATAHAYWWLFNLSQPAVKGLGIHREIPGTPGFTGITMRDRSTLFGYPQASMAEDITHRGDPAAAIKDWVDSVYHRFPLMIPTLDAIGFGEATGGGVPIDVLDMGYKNGPGDPLQTVPYPAPGQADVPAVFLGNELPDPVPPGGKYPTGYPVTLNFNPMVDAVTSVAEVLDPAGKVVDSYVLPATHAEENVLTILPRASLHKQTTYRVHVVGTIEGTPFTRAWSFTTGS